MILPNDDPSLPPPPHEPDPDLRHERADLPGTEAALRAYHAAHLREDLDAATWRQRLRNRAERLHRLVSLDAPRVVLGNEVRLLLRAADGCGLLVQDPPRDAALDAVRATLASLMATLDRMTPADRDALRASMEAQGLALRLWP